MEIVVTIVERVAEPIIDYTVAPIARQVGYLIFYKENFKNLEDQVGELKRVKGTISHEVEVERKNGRQIYDAVQNWLNRVDETIEEAEQLSNDPRHGNVSCCKGPFPNFKSRHKLSRKAKKMAGNVAVVMQRKDNIRPLAFLPDLEGIGSTSTISSEKLESRKKMKENIVLALIDPNLSRMGLYGLGGVGKSTLVKEIAKQVKDEKLFDEVVMANISQAPDLERIQGEIADFLGLRFEEMTTFGRAARLRQRIKNERSILVILDDIWEILELHKLGIPMNDHKGCKLLLTSRNLDILQKMETQKDFLIDVLNEEEAWRLFEDMVGDVVKNVHLREMAIQVAQKCAGLIVLIVTVARALRNKDDIDSWKDALNQLKTIDEEGMSGKIYSALEFSYNHLEGDDVKALFLLCGLVGPLSSVEYLLKCVIGLGIFKHINTPKDARLKLRRLIGSLKASCLLLESNSNMKVKMHDIVHEVAVSIASRDQHVFKIGMDGELKQWPSEGFLQRCTQIILDECNIPKLPERLECPNVKLFYLYNKNKSLSVPASFFEGMKSLKVLDLTCMHLPSLPQSFHSLIDLQTLCLDQCVLGDMTNIGALMNLQILSLYESSMIMLPSELGQLTHLRMLDLTNSGIEIFPPNIISKLTELEELYLGNTSIKWDQGDSIEENKNASLIELQHLKNLTALEIQIKGAWVLPRDIMFDKLERYKIGIGDVWEWSDNYGVSKMLKLKLSTVIHLEHGIKELIKGVEDLYLDEVHGISNVLYDLNGEGFPLLKHLHIQNNGKIQHIINSMKRKLSYVFFPKLETLILQNINILETICDGSFMNNSFARLRSVKVKCCDQLKYLFSVPMVKALCQLVDIEVLECCSIKMIVFVEKSFPNSMVVDENIEFVSLQSLTLGYLPAIDDFYSGLLASSTTTMQSLSLDNNVPSSFINSKVKFSNLETLKLSSINFENIWQDDHDSIANSFNKLANLSVEGCSNLKYLFLSSVVGSFPNLKQLDLRECEMMEEIINIDGENGATIGEVGLPKLETVIISNMKRLKKVWHSQFDGLKNMEVNNCEKLTNIFPFDMLGTFGSLETLNVSNCDSVEDIFQLTSKEIHTGDEAKAQVSQLKKLHLLDLPKLKQIWSNDPQRIDHFHSLQDILVESCWNIEYLFPCSIAVNLPQLEKIMVDGCGMNEIVANKMGDMEEKVEFHFNRLHSLVILNMPKLDRFYNGNHSLICPSLSELRAFDCEKLKLLGRNCTSKQRKTFDGQTQISMQPPLFVIEEVIPKLEVWTLNNKEATMILQDPQWKDHYLSKLKVLRLCYFEDRVAATFLESIVQKAPNLKALVVQQGSLKEIFQDRRGASKEHKKETKTQLENLSLSNVQLLHICREGCQVDPILEVLKVLYVTECDSLKILVPSSVTFCHLTYMEIENCNGLINLISPSTASSLVKLGEMIVRGCNSLEEIVMEEVKETRDEIILFLSLRTLELENLPRLNCFSSSKCLFKFPFLNKVVVRRCPRMKIFCETKTSAPMLEKVIKDGKDEEWCWEGNLNGTINKIFLDKAAFHNSKHLDLSMYPELKESWYSPVENKMFCNLKSLVVKNCDFISNVLISSNLLRTLRNLEEVDVSHCDSLQVVFEFDCTEKGGMSEKEASHLRTISLSNLPELQYIWKQDCQEIASFGDSLSFHAEIQRCQPLFLVGKVLCPNLQVVWVKNCKNLEYLLPFFVAMHAIQLERISIENARSMKQIVSDKEALTDSPVNFEFNHLISLKLWDLDELEGCFAGNHSLLCPLLRELDVRDCAKLKLFKTRYWSSQGGVFDSKSQVSMQQPLFTLEEVICNLERLVLNSENLNMILQGQFSVENFSKLEFLCLTRFKDDQTTFPYWFLQNIATLRDLLVEWSSFREIFQEEIPIDSKGKFKTGTRIKTLTLGYLQNLQHICKEGFQIDPILEDLEYLYVSQCSSLKHLVPSSVTFSHLTYLEVRNCDGLIHLMTSSTAKSLVKLKTMKIGSCSSLKIVVVEDKEGSEDEIAFSCLEILELECLPMIKRFCSSNCVLNLPSLVKVVVKQCPRMNIFSVKEASTPVLQEILSKEEDEKMYWEGDLKRTINRMFMDMVAFRSFKYLELSEYPELRELWYNHVQPEAYGNLKSLVVHKCDFLSDVLLPLNLVQALSHLEELEVSECDSLEAVFDLTNMDKKEVFVKATIQLKGMTLSSLPRLKCIWKQNFQENVNFRETTEGHLQHSRAACSIQQVHLPNLETMTIRGMPELKTIWHPFFTSSCLDNLKMMKVLNCEKLENIFPSYMERAFASLETLMVSDCNSVQVIFEFSSEMDSAEKTTHLQQLTLLRLLKLKQIWSRDPQAILRFHDLQSVRVEHSENLEYLFPLSIAMHAIQLEDITIRNARSMKHIVLDKEGILDGPFIFEFNHLASLVLWKLYELEGFFAGNHIVLCPLLRELDVRQCIRLKLFMTQNTSGRRQRFFDSKLQISSQQSLFTLEEVIGNLERLALNSRDASMILQGQFSREQFSKLKFLCLANFEDDHAIFPYWLLQNITTLTELHVECSSFEEIFQEEIPTNDKEKFKIKTQIEKLILNQLYELHHICKEGSQIDPVLEDLKYLSVQHCFKLKHLVPSSVTCSQLTYLEVQNCNGLIHLITSSTAKSLVNLETMIIRNCHSLEQVVAEDKEPKDVIAFKNLKVLEFECLPTLKIFFSASYCLLELRLLKKFVISNCPRMEIFSLGKTEVPMLEKVLTQTEDGKEYWQGDLNATVNKIFQDMADQVVDTTKQEITNLPSSSDDRQQEDDASAAYPQDAEIHGTIQTDQDMESHPTTRNTEESHGSSIGIQEMCETIKKPSISIAQNDPSSSSNEIPDAVTTYPSPSQAPELDTAQSTGLTKGTQEMGEHIERPMVEAAEIAPRSARVYNAEGSHESETCPRENLFNQPKILATCDNNEAVGSQEIRETMDEPLIQTDQHAQKLATTENTEKSLGDSCIESQKMGDTIKKPSSPTEQNVPNATMIPNIAAIDPSPSKSTQPMMASAILESNAYNDDKWLNYIPKQNLPYLEFGMKRHPQVLNWFNNTKRRGVFTAIFTEVTRILRTTRRCDLTEDDQNHIRECCAALEAVGFDASWLNYVYGCIENCGNGDELIRKLEETEAKASTLRNELASVEASLATLRDKASRLHNFIES